jgi:hypothetical protein
VCRFGSDCHRSDCKWAHACKLCTGAQDASEERKSKACKHGIACWKSCCQFAHPSPSLTCNPTTYFGTVKSFARSSIPPSLPPTRTHFLSLRPCPSLFRSL